MNYPVITRVAMKTRASERKKRRPGRRPGEDGEVRARGGACGRHRSARSRRAELGRAGAGTASPVLVPSDRRRAAGVHCFDDIIVDISRVQRSTGVSACAAPCHARARHGFAAARARSPIASHMRQRGAYSCSIPRVAFQPPASCELTGLVVCDSHVGAPSPSRAATVAREPRLTRGHDHRS